MAPTREEMSRWQRQVAPGDGLRARFDRACWAAASQREPSRFQWPRALMQIALTAALLVALVALTGATVNALVGGTLGYAVLIARAYRLHRRFVADHPSSS